MRSIPILSEQFINSGFLEFLFEYSKAFKFHSLFVVIQFQDRDQYQELFFFANFYNAWLGVHFEEKDADEEDKLEELRMTYLMCK